MKLKDALQDKLSSAELRFLVRGYDVVGDIAITIIPPQLVGKEGIIGAAILATNRHIKVVARRAGNYGGELRIIPLRVIAGENRLYTEHRESGLCLFLNPAEVYFSVRSAVERRRLAGLVQVDEDILVMFSGIGVLPLVLARHSLARKITGIEKNIAAHGYALQNLTANKKINNVDFRAGDVRDIMPGLAGRFARIAMPLPKDGEKFLDLGLAALTKGGWLHFYDFQAMAEVNKAAAKIKAACAANNRSLREARVHICGHVSPRLYRVCVDAQID